MVKTVKKQQPLPIVKKISATDYLKQPWKNGQGVTELIAIDPKEPFQWKISSAFLSKIGNFSPFPGYDRILVPLKGNGISLEIDSRPAKTIHYLEALPILGESSIAYQADNGMRDFNVFTLRGVLTASLFSVRLFTGSETRFPLMGKEHFIYMVGGKLEYLEQNTNEKGELKEHDSLWISCPKPGEFLNLRTRPTKEDATCLWIFIKDITGSTR